MVPITAHFKAHFSICNENTMDVFHGFLHQELQGWFDPILTSLRETENSVCAEYNGSYKGWLAQFLGLSERADQVTTLPVSRLSLSSLRQLTSGSLFPLSDAVTHRTC
jgi:hypothetical protein